jgi:uncharacterized phage protein gp47/JayE
MRSLEDLITPITPREFEENIYETLAILGVDTTLWKPWGALRNVVRGATIVMSGFSHLIAKIAAGGWLELSAGPWLELAAWYVFRERRLEATFATGNVVVSNNLGGVYDFDPEDMVFLKPHPDPSKAKTYRNTAAVHIGSGEQGIVVPVRAVESGSASSAAAGTISELETPLLGVTVSNPIALVGQDEETDPNFIQRCYEKLGSLSPFGPPDAYSFAAKSARMPDGTPIGITRVRLTKDGCGNVFVTFAKPSGAVPGDAEDPETELGVVHKAMVELAAPLSVTPHSASAVPLEVPVTYTAWMYNTSGLTEQAIKAAVEQRLVEYMPTQPIGGNVITLPGKLFQNALRALIASTRPEIFQVILTSPAGDVTVASNQVPVLGTVTGTIIQVPPPHV